jgi:hypothetical protein
MQLRLRTKLTLVMTSLVLLVAAVLSGVFAAQLLDQLLQATKDRAGDLAKQVFLQAQQSLTNASQPGGGGFTRSRDSSGNITDVKGSTIEVTVDFKLAAADRDLNKALKEQGEPQKPDVPSSDSVLEGHELSHVQDQLFQLQDNEDNPYAGSISDVLQEAGGPEHRLRISGSPRSNEVVLAHLRIKPTRRVPQVRRLNLGLAFAFPLHSNPQKPFTHPNNHSALIFDYSLQNI